MGIFHLGVSAYFNANHGRASQAQVEQHKVGHLLLDEFPIGLLAFGSSYDFGLGHIIPQDAFGTFQFERHILYNNQFELFHVDMSFI